MTNLLAKKYFCVEFVRSQEMFFSAMVHAWACTTLLVLATRHMKDHTFVKNAAQVHLTLLLLVNCRVLVVIEVFTFLCRKLDSSFEECIGFLVNCNHLLVTF